MQQSNTEKRKVDAQHDNILNKLLSTQQVIRDNKGNLIEFPRPVLSQNGNAVIYPRTINIIQGKSGVHKSRLVESMCSCLLNKEEHTPNSMGFEKVPYNKYVIAYVDGNSDTIAHPFSENIDHLNQNLMNIINKGLQGVKQDFFLVVNHDWK